MLIYGRNPVEESLCGKVQIQEAFILESLKNKGAIVKLIKKLEEKNIPISFEKKEFFEKIDGNHQGIAIKIKDFSYKKLKDFKDSKRLLILDQIEDPHNFGAIIRSAEAFGFDGIIIGERRSAKVNPTVYKTSVGAINNISIAIAKNLNMAIKELKENGFWIYGLAGEEDNILAKTDLSGKIALVVGNEGKGLSRLVRENCDMLIKIPMIGKINSLNASVATAIAMYEVIRDGEK